MNEHRRQTRREHLLSLAAVLVGAVGVGGLAAEALAPPPAHAVANKRQRHARGGRGRQSRRSIKRREIWEKRSRSRRQRTATGGRRVRPRLLW